MVPLFVLRQFWNVVVPHNSFFYNFVFFFLYRSTQNVLKSPGSFFMTANFNELFARYLPKEMNSLVRLEVLDELVVEKIAESSNHQVSQLTIDLVDDLVDQLLVCIFKVIL